MLAWENALMHERFYQPEKVSDIFNAYSGVNTEDDINGTLLSTPD